jgi:hypothetical protein
MYHIIEENSKIQKDCDVAKVILASADLISDARVLQMAAKAGSRLNLGQSGDHIEEYNARGRFIVFPIV